MAWCSANFDADTRITAMHGWCIPAQGKDYEVKEKDALEGSVRTRRRIIGCAAEDIADSRG